MKKQMKESISRWYYWSCIMILIGIVLILLGRLLDTDNAFKAIFEFIGITLVGVFGVSLIHQKFIADKQFEDFRELLVSQFKEMDAIESKCIKFGVKEIFETRNAYEETYPLMNIIEECPEDSQIISIARSHFHLLNKTSELKKGLEKGLIFKLACVNPDRITSYLAEASLLYKSDTESALTALKDLLKWAIRTKPRGAIELRCHETDLYDSTLIFTSKDGDEKLVWDLSFGRDLTHKRVIILDTRNQLGEDLKSRYMTIYNIATPKIHYVNGEINLNEFDWEFS